MMDKKLVILVGAICVVEGWRLIWLTRNLYVVFKAKIPSNMPHLSEPPKKENLMIQDPMNESWGFIGDATGINRKNMTNTDITDKLGTVGEVYRSGILLRDAHQLMKRLMLLMSTIAKLYTGYHPFIWGLTSRITDDPIFRALFYFGFDNFLAECSALPFEFIQISLSDSNDYTILQQKIISKIFKALGTALLMYSWISLIDKIGITIWSFIPIATGALEMTLEIFVVFFLTHKFSDIQIHQQGFSKLIAKTKFRSRYIRETMKGPFPIACYYSGLVNEVLILSPQLFNRSPCEEGVAILAQELGKKRYWYWPLCHFFSFARNVGICYITMLAYDNIDVDEIFGFLNDLPHPIVSLYLVQTYILPLIQQVMDWISNFCNRRYVFWCDYYACTRGFSGALKNSLLALGGTSNQFPVLDDRWFSIFMSRVPRVQDRVLEIDLHDFLKSRTDL